jgi:hypothetical protein
MFDEPKLAAPVEYMWNAYFAQNAEQTTKILVAAINLATGGLELAHRSVIRTQWKQLVEHKVHGFVKGLRVPLQGWPYGRTRINHKSPLIRVFARNEQWSMSMYSGVDVFVLKFLQAKADAAGLDLGYRSGQLSDSITREEERAAKVQESNEEPGEDDYEE